MKSSPKFLVCSLLLALFLAGCPPKPITVRMPIEPGPGMNNNNSVEVRIYQLKGRDRFERATYDALWNQERETLAEDYIKREQKTVLPRTPQTVEFQKDPQATFVAVAAAFRDVSGDAWKKVMALPPKQSLQVLTVKLDEKTVDLQTGGTTEKKKKNKKK